MTTHTHIRDESGAAMIIAMVVLLITGVLVVVGLSAATQTNGSTRRDANKKNALEAAEAGLQIATYRLNMMRPDDVHCVGDAAALPDSTGTCPSSTYTLGNGSTYNYYTTPALSAGLTCVGSTLSASTTISQRCITAIGSANGVTARAQVRVAAFGAIPLFPVAGITGLKFITNGNNATINGWEASNGTISANNGVTMQGYELGPAGTYAGNPFTWVRLPSPLVLDPVDPGTSNQSNLANCPGRVASCNDDYRITNGIIDPTGNTKPYDQSSGVTFIPATRTLTAANSNATLTLGGGLYNFCEVDINNNLTITLAPGVRTEIFIDSPDDPNSGCPVGTGSLSIKNNVTWINPLNDPTALQIYVYGWNNGQNVVNMQNNNTCVCVLYAPQSTVDLSHSSNNSALTGAVSGQGVNVSNNFTFTYNGSAGTLQARTTGLYYRTAWAQCTPTPPDASAPGSGCG